MDGKSEAAADLLRALMRTATRFSELGGSLHREFFPHLRAEPISDMAGRAVRLGSRVEVIGHELTFEIRLAVDGDFAVEGDVVLNDDERILLDLPLMETGDVGRCVVALDHYADQLTSPARRYVGQMMEAYER